jgi:chromate reductase, NAD(P)H dehydrogenase (quinone)
MNVFAFAGSTRAGSWNKKLLTLAEAELKQRGIGIDHLDFTAATVPVFDDDLVTSGRIPAAVLELKARVAKADGLLLSSPEYNHSIPGPLKNFIDWLSRPPKDNPFKDKPVALLGATTSGGATLQAQLALRHVLGEALAARPVPGPAFTVAKVDEAFDEAGQLKDDGYRRRLGSYLERFVDELKRGAARQEPSAGASKA